METPQNWPGKIATIKLIRALHIAPSAETCSLLDAKYAAEYPLHALSYFDENKTLNGVYHDANALTIIKREFPFTFDKMTLGELLVGAAINNNDSVMPLIVSAIRKYGPNHIIN